MPVLKNPKQERLAQELAKGKTATEAMELAGYSDPRNSTRLTKNNEIRARVVELQERGAKRAEVTVATVTENLLRIALKAEGCGEPNGLSVARLAHMDTAKLAGLEKTQNVSSITIKHDLSGLSDEQLAQLEAIFGSNPNARRGPGGNQEKSGQA